MMSIHCFRLRLLLGVKINLYTVQQSVNNSFVLSNDVLVE